MQLSRRAPAQKKKKKECQYPGCGKIFYGIHIAKFCQEHRKKKYKVKKKEVVDEDGAVRVINHNYKETEDVILTCGLEGCHAEYEVTIYPRQYKYPDFCEDHRNPNKRKRFLERLKG